MDDEARLRLEPSSARGWFGGRRLVAKGACETRDGATLAEAGEALEAAYAGTGDGLTAVLARYDGTCAIARFASVEEAGASAPTTPAAAAAGSLFEDAEWDLSGRDYRAGVRTVRERVAAGDVYVLNLTARLSGRLCDVDPEAAFVRLLARGGAEMSAFLGGLPGLTPWLASISPERFLRVRRGLGGARVVEVCPIKGTRPRGSDGMSDAALADALLADEKELAEHVMVVDLERNDLGRACVPGTVHVDPLYEVVPTPYCHQLVSTVRGVLAPEVTLAGLLEATFPCGSVTGAPKRAAMRIIDALEASERGCYCGALLVAISGELDSSVLIRTLEGQAGPGGGPLRAAWGAGCGITYESNPSAEHLELLLKASPVLGDTTPPVALRETMRVSCDGVPLLERHLERLAAGGCGPSALRRARDAVEAQLASVAAEGFEAGRLGITVMPDGEVVAGYSKAPSTLAVEGGPVLAPVEIPSAPVLPPHAAKPASRRFWDRAHRRAALVGADQALLHLPDGTLVDGSTANVWLVLAGTLVTPPAPSAVAGVARELVFDLASEMGIPTEERSLSLADYASADEVALSNALGGFVAVRGRSGPLTARMQAAVAAVFERTSGSAESI